MTGVRFELNRAGGAEILKSNQKLGAMLSDTMLSTLGEIEAQFFQTFGVEGKFELVEFTTDRSSAKVRAADKATAAILRANPGWLGLYAQNMKL